MASVSVATGPESSYADLVTQCVQERVASRIFAHDATLWGPDAEDEARQRLGWTDLPQSSRAMVDEIVALREKLQQQGVSHVVLCGMGGSSLAPEVICASAGVELTVLDSSQPDMVRHALTTPIESTAVVVSSKSGSTVETDSQRRVFEQAFTDAGIDPAQRMVVVTDPGSPLEKLATERGYALFHADPTVGGRYSAFSAFGLVPSGLAGVDLQDLFAAVDALTIPLDVDSPDNPSVQLGALLGAAWREGIDKLVLADTSGAGLGDWIEQLIAESTGKQGVGILPVVVEALDSPGAQPASADSLLMVLGTDELAPSSSGYAGAVVANLGAQFLIWELATAIAGRILGIDPFDQPDVESAKQASRDLLDSGTSSDEPVFTEDGIGVYGTSATTIADAVDDLLGSVDPEHGYIAIQAYLDRWAAESLARVRADLNGRLGRPVTFGWGPRFLHSTGQYHKGGPTTGVYLQITVEPTEDLPIPGREFTLGDFVIAQASGDASVLRDRGRPVLRLHFPDADTALDRLPELLG